MSAHGEEDLCPRGKYELNLKNLFPGALLLLYNFFHNGTQDSWNELRNFYLYIICLPHHATLFDGVLNLAVHFADAGNPYAQFVASYLYRGIAHKYPPNSQKSFEYAQKASEAKNHYGYLALGFNIERGIGTNISKRQAFELYEKSANEGNGNGCFNTAVFYHNGFGCQRNPEKAFEYFCKSVEAKYPSSFSSYANMLKIGQHCPKDEEKSREILFRGAEVGDPKCMTRLESMYLSGKGLTKDPKAAEKWKQWSSAINHAEVSPSFLPTLLPRRDREVILFYLLLSRTFDLDSPFYKDHLPLDLFKYITQEHMHLNNFLPPKKFPLFVLFANKEK